MKTPFSCSSKTVCFNVGGKIYEVSRSLLEQYPDSMLARLASDTWRPTEDETNRDGKKPALFIQRNGDRFQYCLDYMADGGIVDLPLNVSKNALLQDLAYYGFENVDPSKITAMGSLQSFTASSKYIQTFLNEIETERKYYVFAEHILYMYKEVVSKTPERIQQNSLSLDVSYDKKECLYFCNGVEKVNEFLKGVGLKLAAPKQVQIEQLERSPPSSDRIKSFLRQFKAQHQLIELLQHFLASYKTSHSLSMILPRGTVLRELALSVEYDDGPRQVQFDALLARIGLKFVKCGVRNDDDCRLFLQHI